jgi:hypothetical protein
VDGHTARRWSLSAALNKEDTGLGASSIHAEKPSAEVDMVLGPGDRHEHRQVNRADRDWLTTMRWRLASIAVWITFTISVCRGRL